MAGRYHSCIADLNFTSDMCCKDGGKISGGVSNPCFVIHSLLTIKMTHLGIVIIVLKVSISRSGMGDLSHSLGVLLV